MNLIEKSNRLTKLFEKDTTLNSIKLTVAQLTDEQVWDLGGQTSIRPYWRCYYPNTDAIIFVVDSCDNERLGIAKQELMAMLEVRTKSCDEESLRSAHIPALHFRSNIRVCSV